jgi:hypothetical protein
MTIDIAVEGSFGENEQALLKSSFSPFLIAH